MVVSQRRGCVPFIFLWPQSITDVDIIFLPCGFFFFIFIFFPRLISAVTEWMSYFYTLCSLSANLECRSEIQDTKIAIWAHRTTLSGWIFATKACIDSRKKLIKRHFPHMSPQYSELRPTNGWDPAPQQISTGFTSWQRYYTAL